MNIRRKSLNVDVTFIFLTMKIRHLEFQEYTLGIRRTRRHKLMKFIVW